MDTGSLNFNTDWLFSLGEAPGAEERIYDDRSWRVLSVPHDWSIEEGYNREEGEAATGFLTGGIGWYRKHFTLENTPGQRVYLQFDGVYNRAEFWLNGHRLGEHPYGYSPFHFDLSEELRPDGEENVLAVRLDRTRYVDSRWYTGSGIYRKVELLVTEEIHLPPNGAWVECPKVSDQKAEIDYFFQVQNNSGRRGKITHRILLFDPEGREIKRIELENEPAAGAGETAQVQLSVDQPCRWDVDSPEMYTLEHQMAEGKNPLETRKTRFGIRSFRFDPTQGFFLNGRGLKIKGVCLHHAAGLVGAAVPRDVWKRRLEKLKKMGCNAIRCAHNPPSNEFLDLCDELGFLVQDEFYDEWDYPKDKRLNMNEQHDDLLSRGHDEFFQRHAKQDLRDTIRSHRNHPSIIQWSIGNEIEWTYPRNVDATGLFGTHANGNFFWNLPPNSIGEIRQELERLPRQEHDIGETARKLADWTRELDTTRPIVANCILPSVSFESGYTDALDIVGFSYRRVIFDYARRNYPEKVSMACESLGQWHEWKALLERDFISGMFIWTGIDYMGEAQREGWPHRSLGTGLLNLAGFEKPSYHFFRALWSSEPHLRIYTQTEEKSLYCRTAEGTAEKEAGQWQQRLWFWQKVNRHWNYVENEPTIVEVYTNCPEAELFINDRSLGRKRLGDFPDHLYTWGLPFEEGVLRAVGFPQIQSSNQPVATPLVEDVLYTTGNPTGVFLSADRSKMKANKTDCVHITAQLVDDAGNPVRHKEKPLCFQVEGLCRWLGLDNGACDQAPNHRADSIETHQGRALLILQAQQRKTTIRVTAGTESITSQPLDIEVEEENPS